MKCYVTIFIVLLFCSCGDDKLKKIYKLDSFRILGIQANRPEVSVFHLPTEVALTPIMSDVNGDGRWIKVQISGCADPGVSLGADPSCEYAADRIDYAYDDFNPLHLKENLYSGPMTSINVSIPAGILDGRNIFDKYNGFSYLVTFKFIVSGEIFKSYKRVVVSTKAQADLNTNPTAASINFNNSTLTAVPKSEGSLDMFLASGAENNLILNLDGQYQILSEELGIAWFVSSGQVNSSLTLVNEQNLYTPSQPVPTNLVVIAVIRDGRGGLDYMIQKVP